MALIAEARAGEQPANLKAAAVFPDALQAAVSVDAEPVGCEAALRVALIRVDCSEPAEGDSQGWELADRCAAMLVAQRSAWADSIRVDCSLRDDCCPAGCSGWARAYWVDYQAPPTAGDRCAAVLVAQRSAWADWVRADCSVPDDCCLAGCSD